MPPWSSSFDRMIFPRNFAIFAVPRRLLHRPRSNSVAAGGAHAASGRFTKRERELVAHTPGLLRSAIIEAADQRRAAGIFELHVRVR